MLLEVAQKVLPQAIKPGVLAYCPTMDLVALATRDEQVHVFRLNGQRVFGITNKHQGCQILQLVWKPNGRLLAVAQSTGIILLVNSHTGKVVHQVDCERHSKAQICALGWGVNFVEVAAARTRINEIGKDVTLDDVLSRGLKALDSDAPLDLPADLAFLDAESVLPKLSVLPAVGKEDDVFASRASLDAMFHPSKKDGNDTVDVLVVAFEDGSVHLSIYDFFEIGGFVAPCGGPNLRIVHHCSHPYSSTHGLVVADNEEAPKSLEFAPLDLRLIPDTGRYLSLLASKATQLQNLIRYIREAQTQIHSEFKSSQDLPSRFIRNIDETLQEKESTSFTNAAYHVVATGDCSPSMKEWLVDELGERGQKRWDKAATSGYENLIRFTFENLLPALDRFGVLISRLRGLSRFQGLTSEFGLDTVELEQVLDTLSCLQIHSHTVLQKAGAELRQYTNFSKWMKLEIELQAAEPGSQTAEDVAAKYATLEHPAIFQYIQGALQKSELYELLNVQPADDERPLWEMPPDNSNMYEVFKKALKSSQQGHRDKKLPGLSILLSRLENQCKLVFNRISQTQKRKVSFGKPIPVFNGEVRCFDAKAVIDETDDAELCRYYVAVASKESEIELTKITLRVTNGVSSTESVERAAFVLKRGSMIKDLKFADDSTLMVAQKIEGSSKLLYLPYHGPGASTTGLVWSQDSKPNSVALTSVQALVPFTKHEFTDGPSSAPERLAVNGRKGRRAVCIAAEDGIHYRVFDIDSAEDADDQDAAQTEESDEGVEL